MLFELSNIISLIEIGVNILLAVLIAYFIQRNQLNSRTLKDYYIHQFATLHDEFMDYLNALDSSLIEPQVVTSWFRSKGAKANNLSLAVKKRYNIDCTILIQDFVSLQSDVENDVNFIANFATNNSTKLSLPTIVSIDDYRGNKVKTFHELIGEINDYSKIFRH